MASPLLETKVHVRKRRRRVFQAYNLVPTRTALEHTSLPMDLAGEPLPLPPTGGDGQEPRRHRVAPLGKLPPAVTDRPRSSRP